MRRCHGQRGSYLAGVQLGDVFDHHRKKRGYQDGGEESTSMTRGWRGQFGNAGNVSAVAAIAVESELISAYRKDSTVFVSTQEKHGRVARRTTNSPRVLVVTVVGWRCYGAR